MKEAKENPTSVRHFSIDYGQRYQLPHHPMQPGSIYFKTPYKVDLFVGVEEETNHAVRNFKIILVVSVSYYSNHTELAE